MSSQFSPHDEHWMQQAIGLAHQAKEAGEVPVGAVLVVDNVPIAMGHNSPVSTRDPTAHAEIIVLREAAAKVQNYRLVDAILYVTLEPCLMCAGAMVHARIKRLVYGANDPKAGAIASQCQSFDHPFLNHHIDHVGGLFAEQCGSLLSGFFRERR